MPLRVAIVARFAANHGNASLAPQEEVVESLAQAKETVFAND
jgi:hypothetical protein